VLASGLGAAGILGIMVLVWFILGMFIDSISIMLITVPIFTPLAGRIGYDPIAFALIGILAIEAGLLTPSSATTVPIQPPAPSAGETNPGVTPSAPGPSQANVPRGTSPSARQPGYASSHRQPRAEDIPQRDTNSEDAIKQLDKELSRKLSICRGC